MAEYNKEKLWFLKMPKDFFQGHYMRALEGVPNGKEYELMYLKLMLESTAYNGWLRLSQGVSYTTEMIAGITNTPIDTVRIGLKVLEGFGLVTKNNDGSLFLPQVPELTDYVTKGAEKKKEQRANKTESIGGQKGDKCPPLVHQRDIDNKSLRESRDLDNYESPSLRSEDSMSKPVLTSLKQRELCMTLVERGFIDESELQDSQWDELFVYWASKRDYTDLKLKVDYVLRTYTHLKKGKPDKNGKPTFHKKADKEEMALIANKFLWFKASLQKAIEEWDSIPDDDKPF